MDTDNLLRQSRLERKISLDEVVARTKLPRATVELIDEGRLEELPPGLYGRAYVRSFATAVGLDPAEAVAWCAGILVDVPDPLPALREIAREHTAPTIGALLAERIRVWATTRESRPPLAIPCGLYAAATLDALLLTSTNALVVAAIAHACGVSADVLLRAAGWPVMLICAFTSIAYFVLLAGIGGQTAGMRLCAVPARLQPRPLDLRAIATRAGEVALGEASIVIDWLCTSELPKARESTV